MTSKEFMRPSTTANSQRNPQLMDVWKKNSYNKSGENLYFQESRPFSSVIR